MKKLLILILVSASITSFSQEEKKVWTLRELVDYAISNNLTVKRSSYNVETSEINFLQSKAVMLPTLNASGS